MEQWKNKVAVVTGASSGIGAAITVDLVKAGLIVVGLARRFKHIEALKDDLPDHLKANLHAMHCDVSKESEIVNAFGQIEQLFGGIDVLINNAGICYFGDITEPGNTTPIISVVNTNMLAPIFCVREAVQSMKKRGNRGHIVLINSISGHKVLTINGSSQSANVYSPTKYAVTAMTEVIRQELVKNQSKIKITVRA
jgi:NADP+-dependent farnesol dehydrogenase